MSDETAIHKDVVKSSREQSMEDLLNRRRTVDPSDNIHKEDPVVVEDKVQEDLVTLKVDGQEVKVPKEKVLDAGTRALQKESAADRRLAEASAKEAELKRREEELEELRRQLVDKKDPDDFSREFADALINMEDEEVTAKVSSLVKKITDLEQKAEGFTRETEEVKRERQQSRETALKVATKHFHDNYSDIAGDEEKTLLFNQRVNRFVQENPEKPIQDVIDMAATDFYEKFGGKPQPKESVKDTLINHPSAASARRQPPPAEKPKTRSDVLADLRKGRGVAG